MAWYSETQTIKKKSKKELWVKCKKCQSHIYITEWKENLNVCPKCNYHDSITSYERINLLFDANTFVELFDHISPADPLNFNDLNIENHFNKQYFAKSLIAFRISFITVIVLYSGFGVLDHLTSADLVRSFFIVRYLIIFPVLLSVFLFSFHKKFIRYWQKLVSICFFNFL